MNCKYMKSVAAGRCTGKKLNLDQTTRNLTCGDLEISFVVMYRLGVPGLKKTKFVYLLDLFGGREKNGWCDLMFVERL